MWYVTVVLLSLGSAYGIISNNSSNEPWLTFLTHYNSMKPIALLVDDTEESFGAARTFMRNIFRSSPGVSRMTFYLSTFSTTEMTNLREISKNEEQTTDALSHHESNRYSYNTLNGTLALHAILNAAKILPEGSAILVFTDRPLGDKQLMQQVRVLYEKTIRVYVVWGEYLNLDSVDVRLLIELCKYTGGIFLPTNYSSPGPTLYTVPTKNFFPILPKMNLTGEWNDAYETNVNLEGLYIKMDSSQITSSNVEKNTRDTTGTPTINSETQIENLYASGVKKESEEASNERSSSEWMNATGNSKTLSNGESIARASYQNTYNNANSEIFEVPTMLIAIAQGSELVIPVGGRTAVVVLKITRKKNTALTVSLQCTGQQNILQSLRPWRFEIGPLQTTTSTLTLSARTGVYEDEITCRAQTGSEVIEKKLIVDVGRDINDVTKPSLDYTFLSDCSKVIFAECSEGTWTIEVKARDTGSGLLDVTSTPAGLYFPNGFTSGTKEEITGIYSDSCCNADIQLSAIDRLNNQRTLSANAYRASWSPAQISAVVIGIILLILIIVIIVFLVRWCKKKRESRNLPRYRGGATSRNI